MVVALDAGTTGVRALAIDGSAHTVGLAYREFTQHFPRPGWVEHDAAEIASVTNEVLTELAESLSEPVAAIGITNQRETVVAWSRSTGEPLHRAIVWQDRRTAERCERLVSDGHLELIRHRTGLVADPYFSASKLEWMFNEGGVERTDDLAVGTIDSWLLWKLTGGAVHATDDTNASRTMLYDLTTADWSEELCSLFGVPITALPAIAPSSGRFGTLATGWGLPEGTPISGIAGDQQASLFGQACFRTGMTKNTYGTGSFVLMNVGDRRPEAVDGLVTTTAWSLPDGEGGRTVTYALEGSIFVTGAAIQWLRDGLDIIEQAAEVGPLAESVPDTDGVVIVPAFTGLGSPWWDPYARGMVLGITRGTTKAHLARAVLESIAYQTRDVVDAMTEASGTPLAELRVDGGASEADLLIRIQADQLGVPVRRSSVRETTAQGAAFLAGLAEGVWGSLDDVASTWESDATFEPHDGEAVQADYRRWLDAVERSRDWDRPRREHA
ncbi:MAG: glycerol kinase GlpK [Microthrixaceae bacterium]|nr:glycerol kinase GlpK [Microthrixaceae bacterium]